MGRNKLTDGLHHKKNGVYELQRTIDHKRRSFSSANPAEVWEQYDAAKAESALQKKLAIEHKSEKDLGPLFEEVADEYEKTVQKMKHGTQKAYLPAIRRARDRFAGKRMREIETYMIAEFLKSLSSMARTTVSNQKTVVNAIFQTWIDSPVWRGDTNVAELTKTPHGLRKGKRPPPTDDQIAVVKAHYLEPDALPAVVFLCTGERRGEACAIRLKDIDFVAATISISDAIEHINNRPHVTDTKTEAGIRKIPLLGMLREALEPLRFLDPETYILGGTKRPLTASQYGHRWAAFWRKYGMAHAAVRKYKRTRGGKEYEYHATEWIANVCAHQFRHEYVCMLCLAGILESEAILLVGHANAKMIHEVYLTLKPQMIKEAGQKLDAILTPGKSATGLH